MGPLRPRQARPFLSPDAGRTPPARGRAVDLGTALRRHRARPEARMNRKKEDRIDEEIRHHIDAEARDRRNEGLSPSDARRAALRDFGSVAHVKESTREVWGWTSLDRLAQDVRYGLRMLRRSPGVTALAIVSLAIGIGANTTVYTIVRAGLSAPAGVGDVEHVVNLHGLVSGSSKLISVNYPDW